MKLCCDSRVDDRAIIDRGGGHLGAFVCEKERRSKVSSADAFFFVAGQAELFCLEEG
jgi:hypothetical protein